MIVIFMARSLFSNDCRVGFLIFQIGISKLATIEINFRLL